MAYPRTILPRNVSGFRVPTGLLAPGQTGKDQLRAVVAMGREWDEVYPPLRAGSANAAALLAYIEDFYNRRATFTIEHLITPGSGRAANGAGGGTPLVNGASQTGSSLITDGWSNSITNVARAGDVIRVDGLSPLLRITADANSDGSGNATLSISPPIPAGSSPANNAAITRADCTLTAYIVSYSVPPARPGEWMDGISVTFREAL